MAKFFIVDDEPILHELYRDILEMEGHKVEGQAYNGKDCIDKLILSKNHKSYNPDIILMDHRMPIKNGLETTKELLEKNPKLKIVFLSADISAKEMAISTGSVGFIKKPFNLHSFYSSIDELL